MKQLDEAEKFLRLAAQDEKVLKLLKDTDASDAAWGFHAQQAAEKTLKSVLVLLGVSFPKTHDLALLYQLVMQQPVPPIPATLDELDQLDPFAVEFRYDESIEVSLDRAQVLDLIIKLKHWASSQLK